MMNFFSHRYPYSDLHELNLDWIINEFIKVHKELEDTVVYVDDGKLYIDGKLADATQQAELAELAKQAAQAAQTAAETAQTASEASATASANSATASANSATAAQNAVASTLSQVALLQSRVDNIIPDGTQTEGNTELLDIRVGADGVIWDSAGNAVRGQVDTIYDVLDTLTNEDSNVTTYTSGDGMFSTDSRVFWSEIIPAGAFIETVSVYVKEVASGSPALMVDVWELESGTLTKVKTVNANILQTNAYTNILINYLTEKPCMISYCATGVSSQSKWYRTGQTGHSWGYTTDVDPDTATLLLSSLSIYSNMKLIGGFTYRVPKNETDDNNFNFFSGLHSGNLVVFGDSTVDGTSTTDFTPNVIGTDRTATDDPYVFTSILENMINTFTGLSKRVYNAGFGGKDLTYIATNYASIMTAFDNVTAALIVLDVNSAASGDREEYAQKERDGLVKLIELLQLNHIAIAIATPQPMYYYTIVNTGLPAINSAGEWYYAVNIARDVCEKYRLPLINLGELTTNMMNSLYLKNNYFLGDRIHFGDNGHKVEGYELYGEIIHPIVYVDDNSTYVGIQSNQGELAGDINVYANFIDGWQSVLLTNGHEYEDIFHRIYVLAKNPFTIEGITISGWASGYDVYVDGVLYTTNSTAAGASLDAGSHEITVKPTAVGQLCRYSGLIFKSVE